MKSMLEKFMDNEMFLVDSLPILLIIQSGLPHSLDRCYKNLLLLGLPRLIQKMPKVGYLPYNHSLSFFQDCDHSIWWHCLFNATLKYRTVDMVHLVWFWHLSMATNHYNYSHIYIPSLFCE